MSRCALYVLYDTDLREQPVRYALRALLDLCGVDYELLPLNVEALQTVPLKASLLTYGKSPVAGKYPELHIKSCELFDRPRYLRRESLPDSIEIIDGVKYLYGNAHVEKNDQNGIRSIIVHSDPVASSFFLLTEYEDIVRSGDEDKRGRRSLENAFIGNYGLTDRPWVNLYARQITEWLCWITPEIKPKKRTWAGKPFAIVVTRDIDSIRKYQGFNARNIGRSLAQGSVKSARRLFTDAVRYGLRSQHDSYNNLETILEWERSEGLSSSFFFMTSDLIGDANYRLDALMATHPSVRAAMENGWEAGFHPGYRTFISPTAFAEEQSRFREVFPGSGGGGRQHGLRFRQPYTWRFWEDHGFLYDSSTGFAEREGFRSGCCTPYKTFDLLEDREMNLWELPLTIMDCTLDKYRGFSQEQCAVRLRELAAEVQGVGGAFVLLWHNSYFGIENIGAYHTVLAEFVLQIRDGGAAVLTANSAVKTWAEGRSRCQISA